MRWRVVNRLYSVFPGVRKLLPCHSENIPPSTLCSRTFVCGPLILGRLGSVLTNCRVKSLLVRHLARRTAGVGILVGIFSVSPLALAERPDPCFVALVSSQVIRKGNRPVI